MKKLLILILICTFISPTFALAYIENAPRESIETKKVDTTKIEDKVKSFKMPSILKKLVAPIENIRIAKAKYYADKITNLDPKAKTKVEKVIEDKKVLNKDTVDYKKVLYQVLEFIFAQAVVFYIMLVGLVALVFRTIFRFFF